MAVIGVFDSGMGGLSVLVDLIRAFPNEQFVYLGDHKNVPYGTRTKDEITKLSIAATSTLINDGVDAIVVACNTSTATAEQALRNALAVPLVGIEPELRYALAPAKGKKILVLATPLTLSQPRFQNAKEAYCPRAVAIPAPELVVMVERGIVDGEEPETYFRKMFSGYAQDEIGAVVLGCTHFPFLKRPLRRVLPDTPLVDGNRRVIESLRAILQKINKPGLPGQGGYILKSTSDDPAVIERMRWLMEEGFKIAED